MPAKIEKEGIAKKTLYKVCILLVISNLSSLPLYFALPIIPSFFSAGRITNRCTILLPSSASCMYLSPIPIYFDSSNHLHKCIQYHPEQPLRISVCVERLREQTNSLKDACGFTLCDVSSSSSSTSSYSSAAEDEKSPLTLHQPLTSDELAHTKSILGQAHTEGYVNLFLHKCLSSRDARLTKGKDPLGFIGYVDDGDTYLTTQSYDVCLRVAATWIRSVNQVLQQQQQQETATHTNTNAASKYISSWSSAAVALTRPPGHHAKKTLANGFCIFNFCASAVIHALQVLQRKKPYPRISVLDWDVHYGQGTADILQHYPQVRYVSIHQTPAFPYEGQTREKSGPHRNIFTIPIVADTSWEGGYRDRYENLALPFIASPSSICSEDQRKEKEDDAWIPDLIIISAGYDALDSDPLASTSLHPGDYGKMIHSLQRHLSDCCSYQIHKHKMPGIVLGLEGGYQLQKDGTGLDEAVLATVQALVETSLITKSTE